MCEFGEFGSVALAPVFAHPVGAAAGTDDRHLVVVAQVHPHVILFVVVEEVHSDGLTSLGLFAYFDNPGFQPAAHRVIGVDPVVEADGLAGFPLLEDAGGGGGDGLVVLVGPAGVVDEDGSVAGE